MSSLDDHGTLTRDLHDADQELAFAMLAVAAWEGSRRDAGKILDFLVEKDWLDVDKIGPAMVRAAKRGHIGVLSIMGAYAKSWHGQAMVAGAGSGYSTVVVHCLDLAEPTSMGLALSAAVKRGHREVVRVLLPAIVDHDLDVTSDMVVAELAGDKAIGELLVDFCDLELCAAQLQERMGDGWARTRVAQELAARQLKKHLHQTVAHVIGDDSDRNVM